MTIPPLQMNRAKGVVPACAFKSIMWTYVMHHVQYTVNVPSSHVNISCVHVSCFIQSLGVSVAGHLPGYRTGLLDWSAVRAE